MYGSVKYSAYTCMMVIHMYGSISYCAYICIVAWCTVQSLRNGCRRKIHKANWLCLHMCARMRGCECEVYIIIAYVYVFDVCALHHVIMCAHVSVQVCMCARARIF